MNNKKGDKLISIYWFAILILVAGGVSAMVYIFYSAPYDIREMEATILNNKIADCISQKGEFEMEFLEKDFQDNFLEKCHLNFDVEDENDWGNTGQYYLDVKIYDINMISLADFNKGNKNLVSSCKIASEDYEKLAKCVEGRFYAYGDKQYLIKILSIIRKSEKNVK